MAFTGYDPSAVRTAITNIENSYDTLIDALISKNQTDFVQAMGSYWACEQAKQFFTAYQKAIDALALDVKNVYTSIVNSMNDAANALALTSGESWAESTESTGSTITVTPSIDISSIKEDINGVKGIDLEQASKLLAVLDTILSNVNGALEDTLNAARASGFEGDEIENNLYGAINKIKTNIETAFSQIKTDVNREITDTINKYSTDASNISTAFSGGQSA